MTALWWCPGCNDGFDLEADDDTPPLCRDCRMTLSGLLTYEGRRGRSHLPDPFLSPPLHDWVLDPWGWTIHTLCGLVLRECQPATSGDNLCHTCARKGAGFPGTLVGTQSPTSEVQG